MHRLGLPRQCLLKKTEEFDTVYKHGRRLHGYGFSLIFLKNNRRYSRLGVSVGRKIKGAVVRNRIKRIFKESFRLHRNDYPQEADIVIAVRPDFDLDSPQLIVQAVKRLMAMELV